MDLLFLFVNLPDLTIGGNLYSDLISQFIYHGHNVYVVSNSDVSAATVIKENGANVLRIPACKTTRLSGVKKAFNYQVIAYKYAMLVPRFFRNVKFDAIVSHTLPPEIGLTSWWLKRKFSCPHYLIISDFLWQDGVSLGLFSKNSPICMYYRMMEYIMFKNADLFSAPSKATIDFSKKYFKCFEDRNCRIVRWWQNVSSVEVDRNAVRDQYGLGDKFVVIYGGSVGLMQRGDYLLDLAKSVRKQDDILFLLLGQGDYLKEVKAKADLLRLPNIKFQEFIPQYEYNKLLSACDVGMIILNEKVGTPNVPSKIVSYYCYGIPVLASVDNVTDLGEVLEIDGTGLYSLSGDNDSLKNNLLKMYEDRLLLKQMSEKEKYIFKKYMTPEVAYQTIISQIKAFKYV